MLHVNSKSLIGTIEGWVKRGVVLTNSGAIGSDGSDLKVELSTDCPVEIERASVPLCRTEHGQSETSLQTTSEGSIRGLSVSWSVFVISLVAESVMLVLLFLSISLLVCQLKARRRYR